MLGIFYINTKNAFETAPTPGILWPAYNRLSLQNLGDNQTTY
jgi:hypothetical protein